MKVAMNELCNPEKLGSFLKWLRKKQKLSQQQIADKIFLSRSAVSKIENGEQSIDGVTMWRWFSQTSAQDALIAAIINVDPATVGTAIATLLGG